MVHSLPRPFLATTIAALGGAAALSLSLAQDGSGGNNGTPTQPQARASASASSGADTPSGNFLAITAVGGGGGVLMNATTGAVPLAIPGLFDNASGLSNLPGSSIFTMSGGMASGGRISHFLTNGSIVNVGASGFTSVPACEWVGGTLYGSAAVTSIGDGLILIDPFTGAGTLVGTGYGGGIVGIDSLGYDTTTNTLWGSTGFFFAGTPGQEIIINPISGLATFTGVTMTDSAGFGPSCTVAGMTFDLSGQGYIGIGCGVGDVYSWNPGGSITYLGNNGQGGSSSGVQAVF